MSICCDNPINLGCFNSCEDIRTNVTLDGLGTYTMSYEFNGAVITRQFSAYSVNNRLEIPYIYFNEDYNYTLKLYDNSGVYINCFKFQISPSNKKYNGFESINSVTTFKFEQCLNGQLVGKFEIEFSSLEQFQNGSKFRFTPDIEWSLPEDISYNLVALSSGVMLYTPYVEITDIDDLNQPIIIQITINNPDCENVMFISGGVTGFDLMKPSTNVGVQVPSNTYVYQP